MQTLGSDKTVSEVLGITADKRTKAQNELLRDEYLRTLDKEYIDAFLNNFRIGESKYCSMAKRPQARTGEATGS